MMSRSGPATTGKNRTGTVNGDRGNEVLSQEAVRLFKTQDLGYVRTMRNKALKDVDELEKRAAGIKGNGKKVVFVDDEEEQRRRFQEADTHMNDDDDSEDEEEAVPETKEAKNLRKMQEKEADKLEGRLATARERLETLTEAEQALEMQRARMAKSPSVGGVTKKGVKFKVRERKR